MLKTNMVVQVWCCLCVSTSFTLALNLQSAINIRGADDNPKNSVGPKRCVASRTRSSAGTRTPKLRGVSHSTIGHLSEVPSAEDPEMHVPSAEGEGGATDDKTDVASDLADEASVALAAYSSPHSQIMVTRMMDDAADDAEELTSSSSCHQPDEGDGHVEDADEVDYQPVLELIKQQKI